MVVEVAVILIEAAVMVSLPRLLAEEFLATFEGDTLGALALEAIPFKTVVVAVGWLAELYTHCEGLCLGMHGGKGESRRQRCYAQDFSCEELSRFHNYLPVQFGDLIPATVDRTQGF
jgi:hypothetical protein